MSTIATIGIIGMGSFGRLIDQLIPKNIQTVAYRRSDSDEKLHEVAQCDILFLAIPLSSYPDVFFELRNCLSVKTLLVDVCSVKMKPEQLIQELLPDHKNVLLTHPLFGPESFSIEKKHTLIVTSKTTPLVDELIRFCKDSLKFQVLHMSSEEHDKRMADVHALTFFIARGLSQLNLIKEPFMTPSFQSIIDLISLDKSQSEELFQTIENGNTYSNARRTEFIDTLIKINQRLEIQ